MIYDTSTGFHDVLVNLEWLSFSAFEHNNLSYRFQIWQQISSTFHIVRLDEIRKSFLLTLNRSRRLFRAIYVNRYVTFFFMMNIPNPRILCKSCIGQNKIFFFEKNTGFVAMKSPFKNRNFCLWKAD